MIEVMDVEFDDEVAANARPVSARTFRLRDYQHGWIDQVKKDRDTFTRILGVGATGTGKTTFFAAMAHSEVTNAVKLGGRVLVLENRDKLVRQTAKRISQETGVEAEIEMAGEHASPYALIVVASVQTLCKDDRLTGFAEGHFSLVIADESHHALSKSWQKVLNYFHYGASSLMENWEAPLDGAYEPKCTVIGVTATPELANNKNLGEFYQVQSFFYTYIDAVRDGWLVPPRMMNIPLKMDLRSVRVGRTPNGSDFNSTDLSERLIPVLEALADQIVERASDRKGIVFVPSIECARILAEALCVRGLYGIFVSGECLDVDEKTENFVNAGTGTFLCNACLDFETEILTDRGWIGVKEITPDHRVANWCPNGTVFFAKPKRIINRPLDCNEHMVSCRSKTVNFRVTSTHDMVVRCGEDGYMVKKIKAKKLTNRHIIPTNGIAAPENIEIQDEVKKSTRSRRITANSHTLRSRNGYGYDESISESTRRENIRSELKFTQPKDLTIDDCRFIGFWIADGGRYKLATGGVEYRLTQSTVYPEIIKWIDAVISQIGIDSLKKFLPDNNGFQAWQWHICRGTGGGSQERVGVYRLEPYLNKNGTNLFWALNEHQFDALIEGYWYGDGAHLKAENGIGRTALLKDTKKPWIELLCAIGPVRGWRCAMSRVEPAKAHHLPQWRLSMIKGIDSNLSHRTKILHEKFNPENVWCVEVDSGNIITRRGGKVIVTGNCLYVEGADFPDVNCVVPARATKSSGFYKQQVGRGTRVLPGTVDHLETPEERREAIANSAKPDLLILDPLWISDRIDLCDAYDLFTDKPEVKAKMKEGGYIPSAEAAEQAARDLIAALTKEAKKHKNREARVIDPLALAVLVGDSALADWRPQTDWDSAAPTAGQISFLKKQGIDADKIQHKGLASKIIGRVMARHKLGLATGRQLSLMSQLGLDEATCSVLTEEQASATIDKVLAEKKLIKQAEKLGLNLATMGDYFDPETAGV